MSHGTFRPAPCGAAGCRARTVRAATVRGARCSEVCRHVPGVFWPTCAVVQARGDVPRRGGSEQRGVATCRGRRGR
ncbi:hypothetical protein FTX61_19185 [Nitriliruptoraceae bacterium ZYF776]|nr:hypothetical protein [Profundirhabdus halotolerans]